MPGARVHEPCGVTVSVVGCGRMGCAIAGTHKLSRSLIRPCNAAWKQSRQQSRAPGI
tara:strand:- start:1854 stop:2024 length:171 start_codon:yes stop_codon:yes gene_type:complete